jgi:hypothetical protein
MDEYQDNPAAYEDRFTPKKVAHLHHVRHPADMSGEADAKNDAPSDEGETTHDWQDLSVSIERTLSVEELPAITECLHDVFEAGAKIATPLSEALMAPFSETNTSPDHQATNVHSDNRVATSPAEAEPERLALLASIDIYVPRN